MEQKQEKCEEMGEEKGSPSLGRNPGPPQRRLSAKRFCRWKELSGRGRVLW